MPRTPKPDLSYLQDDVYFRFRKAQVKAMETVREGVLHVSDVISACLRMVHYKKTDPQPSMTTESMRALYMGQIIHAHSMLSDNKKFHEIKLAYDYVEDKVINLPRAIDPDSKEYIKPDDPKWYDILIGSIDDLVKIGENYMICDKKTTASIDWFSKATSKPSEYHVDQINHYRVLLKKCMDIDATYGCVIYISSVKTLKNDRPVPLAFPLAEVDETLEKIKSNGAKIKDMMLNGEQPERTRCYMCDGICDYAQICFAKD